jgi:CMP/dCMP kinase
MALPLTKDMFVAHQNITPISGPASFLPGIIALDGPAAVGKTSIAYALAQEFGYLFVDTGAFYRAATLATLQAKAEAISDMIEAVQAAHFNIGPSNSPDGRLYTMLMNEQDITHEIRSKAVEQVVSKVAAIPEIRDILNQKYRAIAKMHPRIIMAGRDVGTVVLPDADLKIYLEAAVQVRADRRYKQMLSDGKDAQPQEVESALVKRDDQDSRRAVAPLQPATDAHIIHTDQMTASEVLNHIRSIVLAWRRP